MVNALWRSTFLRGSASSHSEHFQLTALSALALFAVLVAGLALQLAVQRTQQLAAQQSARSPLACDVLFFSFFPRLGVDNRGLAAEQPTLADRSARAPSPCEGQG
jgi:hypothetical protein